MNFFKYIIILSIGFVNTSLAQITSYRHYTLWSRVSVSKTWAEHWEFSAEYQHRRQNYHKDDINLLQSHLLHSFRARVRYAVNEQLTISVLPFTFFYASPLLGNEKDYQRKPDKEIRFAMQAELKHKISKVEIFNRYGVENRWIKRAEDHAFQPVNRIRYRLLLERPWVKVQTSKEKFRPYMGGEILFNAGKGITLAQTFEHLRTLVGIRWNVHQNLRLDTGYQYARRLRRNGTEGDHEHSLVTNLAFYL